MPGLKTSTTVIGSFSCPAGVGSSLVLDHKRLPCLLLRHPIVTTRHISQKKGVCVSILFTTGPHSNNRQAGLSQLKVWESLRFESQGAVTLAGLHNSRMASWKSVTVLPQRTNINSEGKHTSSKYVINAHRGKTYTSLQPLYVQFLTCTSSVYIIESSSC